MNLETSAIIEAIKAGSEKILFNIYEEYRNDFVSWAIRHHQISAEEAKDVFQESVIALYKNVKADKMESTEVSIKTYLFGIGKNIILNAVKRRGIEEKVFESFNVKTENGIHEHYEHEHLVSLVKRLYRSMGSPCKEILEMFYEKGFDMESIATRIGYKNSDVAKKKKYECLSLLESRISKTRIKEMLN
ncbi:MAG: sigma-70 family RNA polymerase sigma factor [Bacteroidetes bacterium]|nr:sigma-70 family RNA polymerase sigma factor [Bacteroidota bacterium]MBS1980778.1 sigma-70 family RNA polymerase sigma factor [Bacteroidota bacterium]